jgi:hypothetical protein
MLRLRETCIVCLTSTEDAILQAFIPRRQGTARPTIAIFLSIVKPQKRWHLRYYVPTLFELIFWRQDECCRVHSRWFGPGDPFRDLRT